MGKEQTVIAPFHLQNWIQENKSKLKPPVGNLELYEESGNFIVMVVGGPNSRLDFHVNTTEELFYQLEGSITVRIINHSGKPEDIQIKAGEMFLLPARIPHCPMRPAGSIGLVVEMKRGGEIQDQFQWYCRNCWQKIHEESLPVEDIVKQLPELFKQFYQSDNLNCNNCQAVHPKP